MFSPLSRLVHQLVHVQIGLSGGSRPKFGQALVRQGLLQVQTFAGPPCLYHPPSSEQEEAWKDLYRVQGHCPHERDQGSPPLPRDALEQVEA